MDPATYEHLRNKTLLFFIEKLLDPSHGGGGGAATTTGTGGASSGGGGASAAAAAATGTGSNPNNNNNNNELINYTNKRTLHDLSCQFGSKGFTKEMRQIAGGSQSGLKKFLQSYPSIFRLDGDMVSYNVNSSSITKMSGDNNNEDDNDEDDGDNNKQRVVSSIDNEAVEYFRERLMQYGIGIWVPVKSLLGHRSQAPPHIRHVSGQHIREFTTFLSKYPTTFVLNTQDEVLLKEFENYYNENSKPGGSGDTIPIHNKLLIDKKRIVELIEFYANCLVERGPMLVEQLFCAGNLKYDDGDGGGGEQGELNESGGRDVIWEYFRTPGDLCTFFKMYPQCFQVREEIHMNL